MQQPQPNLFPFGSVFGNPFLLNAGVGDLSDAGFESSRFFFLVPFLLFQGGGMDFSNVGEKFLSSVRSARSLGLLPSVSSSDRPEVPARAAAAAAIARALAGLPPHQRYSFPSASEELRSIYGSRPQSQVVEELEEDFYEEEFDPIKHILENIPSEEIDLEHFEKQATLRLAQLDIVAEQLSHRVMEHHEVMVKGMNLVRELERDLKVANIICMNGRRHLTSSMNEVSRDLVVNTDSKKKQALMDLLLVLAELLHARDMQVSLESLVQENNYCKAFQVLSEYLQVLDSFSELSVIQEMSNGVEFWLGRALQKLDSLLLGVCQEFKEEGYLTILLRPAPFLIFCWSSACVFSLTYMEINPSFLFSLYAHSKLLCSIVIAGTQIKVVDAYALLGDISGLAEKMQSFFMQEVISETHSVLKSIVHEDQDAHLQSSRLTYSDLCLQIPESKFRQCLLKTLAVLFKLICSYHEIMSFQLENEALECPSTNAKLMEEVDHNDSVSENPCNSNGLTALSPSESVDRTPGSSSLEESTRSTSSTDISEGTYYGNVESHQPVSEGRNGDGATSSSGSPWYHLRKEAIAVVSQTLLRGRKNLWQLTTSRVLALLSSSAASTSIHQFLKNYEDLNTFILAGEAFCGVEVVEFRKKLKGVCENYFSAFHQQNISALKMVLEKETWLILPPEMMQIISFAGLVGDGVPFIVASDGNSSKPRVLHTDKSAKKIDRVAGKSGFSPWVRNGNPFLLKLSGSAKEANDCTPLSGATSGEYEGNVHNLHVDIVSSCNGDVNHINGSNSISEEENEDLLADFIDEDSQLPSRISKPNFPRSRSLHFSNDEFTAQTGSSVCLLRSMDKYARLMQKLEIVNVEFFKGICQLFEMFFYYLFEAFGQQNTGSSGKAGSLTYRLKRALSRITVDCDQWIKSPSGSLSSTSAHADVTRTAPQSSNFGHAAGVSFGLKDDIDMNLPEIPVLPWIGWAKLLMERCAGADTLALVSRILHRSRTHLQSLLLKSNTAIVEDFFEHVVDSVPDLTEHMHRTTARVLLHINGTLLLVVQNCFCLDFSPKELEFPGRYVDRIANAKWELKDLGMEHNGYVDLLLGEFKHYKTRLAHGGIHKEVHDLLLDYGLEIIAETLIEGLSRVKRCTDEGRALMSLDLQVLINGLQHFVSLNVKPKLQIVETFIKAYYLPETEYVHWARAHPEYSKNQIVGLINLVASMKGWKRKARLEVLEKIE
ncbi:hypothetical protein CXB51_016514 [Gossypium anomalum]|uniref:Syndetin n=1 Tax=Gossypium anomalum TaxID=47600 RepID=A0A8J5YTD3_9ROSI|nr:hypothetical protein CXB51_016514 [Gossypium anomalum]